MTHDLELAVVVFVLKIWCHYLCWVHVDVFTNYTNLQYVFSKKKPQLKEKDMGRASKRLWNNYDVSSDKANVVANALSRVFMGDVPHIQDEKIELGKKVYYFANVGIRLCGSSESGVLMSLKQYLSL